MKIETTSDSLAKLHADLKATGVPFSRMWIKGSAEDGELVLFNDKGEPDDTLLDDPRVVAAVKAHVPDAPIPEPQYGTDEPPENFRGQAAQAVQQLRSYLAISGTPTNAQTSAALKVVIRTVLFTIRRLILPPPPPVLERVVTLAELPEQMPGADIAAEILAERERELAAAAQEEAILAHQQSVELSEALTLLVSLSQAAKAQGISSEELTTAIIQMAQKPQEPANPA